MLNPTGIKRWSNTNQVNPMVDAPQPAYPRQDADYQKPFSFSKVAECVQDNITGLLWAPSGPVMAWGACAAYASQARFGDYSDWRMPTVKELEGLVDYGIDLNSNPSPGAIDQTYFGDTAIDQAFWTSEFDSGTVAHGIPFYGWATDFS